ncbi:MAG: murein biosynthesis integral membrane protein MurJ [Spirochaetaceae bacterium]|nr:murein biosynthesis integral membrane protein MurJ [Spirochaetaceae bacterium]MBP5329117.1 murein biosynthesis integral membrane protein MurJ [Spirochaetaceae bacterium]
MKKKTLAEKGITLSILTLISRILGVLRETTKASFLGTSALADAFTVAFQLPNLFRRLFAENSISVAFIPTFRSYLEENDNKKTQELIYSIFTIISFLTTIVVLIGIIFAPQIVPLFTDNPEADILPEMAFLTRIMFPYLIVISIAALFQGILNSLKIFSPSGFTPILFNICVIGATYIFAPHFANPARAMALGVITGGTIQALFQLPFVLKQNWKIGFTSLRKAFANPGTKTILRLIGPTVVGMAAYQLNTLVSQWLAGKSGTGIVSSLSYSLRLQELILGVFAVTIGSIILPDLSALAKKEEWNSFNTMLEQAMNIIALITVPITAYSLIFGENIIIFVFKSKNFTSHSVQLTLQAFTWHIAGLYFIALNRIIAPAFYAQKLTKLPSLAGIISVGVNIILAAILSKFYKGAGIAFALSAASLVNTILLFVFMKSCNGIQRGSIISATVKYLLKITAFSIIAVIPTKLIKPFFVNRFAQYNRFVAQGIPLAAGAVVFFSTGLLLLWLSKDPMLSSGLEIIKQKLKKQADDN